jgi:hypothetical protein
MSNPETRDAFSFTGAEAAIVVAAVITRMPTRSRRMGNIMDARPIRLGINVQIHFPFPWKRPEVT